MKILYVPFTRDKAGDLRILVELWKKNYIQNFDNQIEIIYHGDESELEQYGKSLEIFICAHGTNDQNEMIVLNNADSTKAESISIQTVADRFNYDFTYVAHLIDQIHIYCCGSQEKNRAICKLVQSNLVLSDHPLYYYNGSVTIVDEEGKQWSLGTDKKIPVQTTVVKMESRDNEDLIEEHRAFVKSTGINYEDCLDLRRDSFFARVKKDRQALLKSFRKPAVIENTDSSVEHTLKIQ